MMLLLDEDYQSISYYIFKTLGRLNSYIAGIRVSFELLSSSVITSK